MNYERINWENAPSTDTPLDADNLNKMDEALDTLNREVAKTRSDVQEVEETAASLGSQIAGIIRLEDGSTTGDAELINGRVGKDGTTYSTIGDAIRGQIGDLRDHVVEVSDEEPEEFYNKIWVNDSEDEIEIPTKAELDAIEDEVDELNERFDSEATENGLSTIITGWTPHYYIKTNGETVDVTTPVQAGDQRMRYVVLDCNAGDVFRLEVAGGSAGRAYCFIDASGNVLEVAGENAVVHSTVIAPANAKKLILNDLYDGDTVSWIGYPLDERIDNLESVYVNNVPIVSGLFQRTTTGEYERSNAYMTTGQPISLKAGDRIHLETADNTMGFVVYIYDTSAGAWAIERAYSSNDYVAGEDKNIVINIRNSSSTTLTSTNVKDIALLHYHAKSNKFVGTANEKVYFSVITNSHAFVNNPDSAVDTDTDSEAYVIQNAVVALPANYNADESAKPVPVVMMCHGFAGNVGFERWYSNSADFLALVTALTGAGYAVFDVSDTTNSENGQVCDLGCPQLLEAYTKAFKYIRKNYNVQDKCVIYGMSHGTYTGLNMVREHGNIIKAMCIGGAVVSCYYYFVFQNGTFSSTIARKFGFIDQTGSTYEADKMKPYDNYANILTIANEKYLFGNYPPIKILLGGDDNLQMNGMAEETFGAIKNAGNLVYLRTVDNFNHHDITTSNSVGLRNEVIDFFNRYK